MSSSLFVSFQAVFHLDQKVAVINPDPSGPWGGRAGRETGVRACAFPGVFLFPLGVAEVKGQTLLAGLPLVLEDRVDVVHLAQPLKERDEVQQLRVGHVVKPRGHGNLRRKVGENNKTKQNKQKTERSQMSEENGSKKKKKSAGRRLTALSGWKT